MYYTWKKKIKSYKNNNFKILAPRWNEKFDLSDEPYFVPDIQDYFEYMLKKPRERIDNPSIISHVNKIENKIISKIKRRYYLKFLTPEIMKLLGSANSKIKMVITFLI